MLDVGWGDLLGYFGNDSNTKSILLYMESIGNARSFLSAAREVSLDKPVVVIKAGRSEAASRAAASHTGAMTGSDEVYEAAFRRCGVLRVETIAELFQMADVLGKQPRPRGPRLTILTNAGGPGVLATDALLGGGGTLAPLSAESEKALGAFLPAHWSHANPIDILGDADPDRYAHTLDVALADPNSDGLLVILAPQGMTDPTQVAERVKMRVRSGKPVLASWMGGRSVTKAIDSLNAAGIPVFSYPDAAAGAFQSIWAYSECERALYEPPFAADEVMTATSRHRAVREIIDRAVFSGRTLLTEFESKTILELYGIPTVPTRVARGEEEAALEAEKIGYPVVLKLHSETVTHKSDVGGVRLNLTNREQVRQAYRSIADSVSAKVGASAFLGVTVQPMIRAEGYELILGSSVDPQFGPVLLFGSGGQLVEVYRDRALGLPPLNTTLARRMMERTKIFSALQGVRGRKAVDEKSLEIVVMKFSELVAEHPRIREIDINPLLASSDGILALDARIVLLGRQEKPPRAAIRPYPIEYVWPWKMKDGQTVIIRPIRAEDESRMVEFHRGLSDASVYSRYFQARHLEVRVAHDRLVRNCFLDYDREMALVAGRVNNEAEEHELLGVGRLVGGQDERQAELGVVVADRWQGAGLGTELVKRLIEIAQREGIERISAEILSGNAPMVALATHFHFELVPDEDLKSLSATLRLDSSNKT
jgi:acetyltransferase